MPDNDKLKNSQPVDTSQTPPVEKPPSSKPPLPQTPTETPPPLPGQDVPTPPSPPKEEVSAPPPPPPKPIVVAPKRASRSRLLGLVVLLFLLASIPAAVYLVRQRQEIRKKAAPEEVPSCAGKTTINCWGECQPGTCKEYEVCCTHKTGDQCDAWCQNKLVNENSANCGPGCGAAPTPTPTEYTSCASWGYDKDPTCTADPNCEKAPQNGFCCVNKKGASVCCYRNGECFEGQQGNCEDRGNGCLWLKEGITTTVYKMVESYNVSCPYSSGNRVTVFSGTVPGGGQVYCLASGECGQIEATGYCGSCKATGCGVGPTSTPTPTATPTPGPTATPTPTPTYSGACQTCKMYDSNWKVVTDYTDLEVGQKVYLTTTGSTDHPQGVTKARFRINGGAWQETTKQKDNKFYIQYTIAAAGSYQVEAMVYNPELGWF